MNNTANLPEMIINAALSFRSIYNEQIDEVDIDFAYMHDSLHYYLGIGITPEDESVIACVEGILAGLDVLDSAYLAQAEEALSILPDELYGVLQELYS